MLWLNKHSEVTTLVLCYAVNGVRDYLMAKWQEIRNITLVLPI